MIRAFKHYENSLTSHQLHSHSIIQEKSDLNSQLLKLETEIKEKNALRDDLKEQLVMKDQEQEIVGRSIKQVSFTISCVA